MCVPGGFFFPPRRELPREVTEGSGTGCPRDGTSRTSTSNTWNLHLPQNDPIRLHVSRYVVARRAAISGRLGQGHPQQGRLSSCWACSSSPQSKPQHVVARPLPAPNAGRAPAGPRAGAESSPVRATAPCSRRAAPPRLLEVQGPKPAWAHQQAVRNEHGAVPF